MARPVQPVSLLPRHPAASGGKPGSSRKAQAAGVKVKQEVGNEKGRKGSGKHKSDGGGKASGKAAGKTAGISRKQAKLQQAREQRAIARENKKAEKLERRPPQTDDGPPCGRTDDDELPWGHAAGGKRGEKEVPFHPACWMQHILASASP
jgi:hypothetical protein